MPFSRRRMGRPWFLEFDFYSGCAAISWGIVAYLTRPDFGDNQWFRALAFMDAKCWALTTGAFGAAQVGCVVWNTKWGRWFAVVAGTLFWTTLSLSILTSLPTADDPLPQASGLYCLLAAVSFLCVVRMPREYPPRAG